MSGIYDITLGASGGAGNIGVSGSYAKIITAPQGPVQIKLDGGEAYTLLPGQGVRLPDGQTFRDVAIVNKAPSAQLVTLFIGNSNFEDTRISGVVSITNAIGAATQMTGGGGGALLTAGWQTLQLIAPASNVRGAVVRTASAGAAVTTVAPGNSCSALVVAAAATPTSNIGAAQLTLAQYFNTSATYGESGSYDKNILLPIGWGIWLCASNQFTTAATLGGNCSVELL
jgi:hypothetical protein